jgi:hypothetical protein
MKLKLIYNKDSCIDLMLMEDQSPYYSSSDSSGKFLYAGKNCKLHLLPEISASNF